MEITIFLKKILRIKSQSTQKFAVLIRVFVAIQSHTHRTCNFSSQTIPVQLIQKFVKFSLFTFPSRSMTRHSALSLTTNAQQNQ